jgi:hypothetical protein
MQSKKSENPLGKSSKVAKFCFGADEAVVAKLPKRVPQKCGMSEGLHKISSFIV